MNQMTLVIEQNVAVVPVLDLNEVGDDTVGRTALDEIPLGREELFGVGGAEFIIEISQKAARAGVVVVGSHLFLDLKNQICLKKFQKLYTGRYSIKQLFISAINSLRIDSFPWGYYNYVRVNINFLPYNVPLGVLYKIHDTHCLNYLMQGNSVQDRLDEATVSR